MENVVGVYLLLNGLKPGQMLSPVVRLSCLLVHFGVRVVDVLAPGVNSAGNIGDEVLDSRESLGRIDTLVDTVVKQIHEEIIAMGIR